MYHTEEIYILRFAVFYVFLPLMTAILQLHILRQIKISGNSTKKLVQTAENDLFLLWTMY